MSRTPDPSVAERNQQLIEFHSANPTASYELMCRKFGMSNALVYAVLSKAGRVGRDLRPTPREKTVDQKAISNFHVLLGAEVSRFLNECNLARQVVEGIDEGALARQIGMSKAYFNKLKIGLHDPTLYQLEKIAEWMSLPLSELISRIEQKTRNYGKPPLSSGS